MIIYWYAYLISGVLLLSFATVMRLSNMKTATFKAFSDTPDPKSYPTKLSKKSFNGLVVDLTVMAGLALTVAGAIAVVVNSI